MPSSNINIVSETDLHLPKLKRAFRMPFLCTNLPQPVDSSLRIVSLLGVACVLTLSAQAQSSSSESVPESVPISVSASEAVPSVGSAAQHSVVRWSGTLTGAAGRTADVRFAIYAEQSRGLALWSETQPVKVGLDGRYSVLLGATSAEGLPQTLFPSGEPRWMEMRPVSANGDIGSEAATSAPRSLFAAVPYAFKSIDAETLAGRSAAEYLTRDELQSAVAGAVIGASPTPLIAGTGATGALAVWTGSATLGNSIVTESGTNLGIGTLTPATTLDVNGASTLRGALNLPPAYFATTTSGFSSPLLELSASSYSSATHTPVSEKFAWQNVNLGNNTASPTANLELLFGLGTATPTATGLSIAPNGQITFAAGQKFPGVGAGSLTGVTASSPLTGGGTSGTVAIGLNTATLETTLNGVYPQLKTYNHFLSGASFVGPIAANSDKFYGVEGTTNTGIGVLGYATGANAWGVDGYATGSDGVGVSGYATAVADVNGVYPTGVLGRTLEGGTAVKGVSLKAIAGYAAVLGQSAYNSSRYQALSKNGSLAAGVWGDIGDSSGVVGMAVAGTADNGYAGVFENKSAYPTIYVFNASGSTGLFKTMMVGSPAGTCGIGGSGDLTCTGQIKSLVNAGGGTRKMETYAVQSPENWMEDFGSGSLHGGVAIVTIDPVFGETVSGAADYRIFLTPNGDSKGLYVFNKTATSFEVRESGGGTASIGFDYRIVAKRRGYESQRLTDVTERFNTETTAARHPLMATQSIKESKP
jgi:hypothetical protein